MEDINILYNFHLKISCQYPVNVTTFSCIYFSLIVVKSNQYQMCGIMKPTTDSIEALLSSLFELYYYY